MNLENEFWKDIPNYEGLYQVSNFGRVKNLERKVKCKNGKLRTNFERILVNSKNKLGYEIIRLSVDSKVKSFKVHQLVARAFIPNPNNYPQINHKDENPSNNHVDNLEWCTALYNSNYGNHNKKLSESQRRLFGKKVLQYDLNGVFIREYPCLKATEDYGFSRPCVSDCCKRITPTYKGYVFRFKGEPFSLDKKYKSKTNVEKYDMDGNLIELYTSIYQAQKQNGIKRKLRTIKEHGGGEVFVGSFKYKVY